MPLRPASPSSSIIGPRKGTTIPPRGLIKTLVVILERHDERFSILASSPHSVIRYILCHYDCYTRHHHYHESGEDDEPKIYSRKPNHGRESLWRPSRRPWSPYNTPGSCLKALYPPSANSSKTHCPRANTKKSPFPCVYIPDIAWQTKTDFVVYTARCTSLSR